MPWALLWEWRKEEREAGRRGVVGREMGERGGRRLREVDRGAEAVSMGIQLNGADGYAIVNYRRARSRVDGVESACRTGSRSSGTR